MKLKTEWKNLQHKFTQEEQRELLTLLNSHLVELARHGESDVLFNAANPHYFILIEQIRLQIGYLKLVANLPFPVRLGLGTTFASFVILMTMPHHPLAIPASFGAGLALNLVTLFTYREIMTLRNILANRQPINN